MSYATVPGVEYTRDEYKTAYDLRSSDADTMSVAKALHAAYKRGAEHAVYFASDRDTLRAQLEAVEKERDDYRAVTMAVYKYRDSLAGLDPHIREPICNVVLALNHALATKAKP